MALRKDLPHNTLLARLFRSALIVICLLCIATQYAAVLLPGFSPIIVCIVTIFCASIVLLTEPGQNFSRKLPHQTQRNITIAFWGIIIIAAILRIRALSPGVVHVDAFFHLLGAQNIINGIAPGYLRALLYTLMVTITEFIFGQNVTVVMVMNMIINLSTLGVLYIIARKLFSSAVAVCAVALLAFSPWSIIMSDYIRMYDLFQLCTLICVYVTYRFFTEGSKRKPKEKTAVFLRRYVVNALIVLAVCGVTFHVHTLAVSAFSIFGVMLIGCAVYQVIHYLYLKDLKGLVTDRFVIGATVVGISSAAFYTLFPSIVHQFATNFSLHVDLSELIFNNRGYYQFFLHQFPAPLMGFFVGIAIAGACVYYKRSPQLLFFVFLCLGLLVQLPFFDRYFSPRYAYHILPLLVLVIAIGIVLFSRVLTRTYFHSYPGASGNIVTIVVCVLMVAICIPYNNLTKVYIPTSNGEDQIYEISYPYARILKDLNIQPSDDLFSLNYGIWNIFQNTSSHIYPIVTLNIAGKVDNKKEVANNFFGQLSRSSHAWFLSDIYRQEYWDCGVEDMNPCIIREFIDEAFTLTPEHQVDNLLLYEWKPQFFDEVTLQNIPQNSMFVGGNMVRNIFWMDTFELTPGIVDGTINVSHTVRSLENNAQGAFVVMHPTGYRADGSIVTFEKEVLFVPAYADSADVMTYTFPYTARQPLNLSDIKKIAVTLIILDVAAQQMIHEDNPLTVYARD